MKRYESNVNRNIEIYSISMIEEMMLSGVDDEVIVKENWEVSKKEFKPIYLPISSKLIKIETNNNKWKTCRRRRT